MCSVMYVHEQFLGPCTYLSIHLFQCNVVIHRISECLRECKSSIVNVLIKLKVHCMDGTFSVVHCQSMMISYKPTI